MTLGSEIVPLPGEVDHGFLSDLAELRRAREVAPLSGELAAALGTVASVSPFLKDLMLQAPDTLDAVLGSTLSATIQRTLHVKGEAVPALRRAKQEVALAVGLADLCADASVEAVTGALSTFADFAIAEALRDAIAGAHGRGQLAVEDPALTGLFVLGMGKLGGGELNYSSDVDLVALYDRAHMEAIGGSADRATRLVQQMTRTLQERTEDGYVFRVDLRLRPDPGATPVAVSTAAAIRYFQSRARGWERQAMIKARFVAGDRRAAERYLAALEPSLWHTGYEFGAIDETMALREQIAAVRGAGAMTAPKHNVKLGRGGIREVEFFVQSLQRVAGGRDPRLRGRSTVPMLKALCDRGWIGPGDRDALIAAYRYLRKVEHRLQMVSDAHVHTLPDAAGLPRIARMMRDDDFEATLRGHLEAVHARTQALTSQPLPQNPLLVAVHPLPADLSGPLAEEFDRRLEAWRSGSYGAFRTEKAVALLERLTPSLRLAVAAAPDGAGTLEGLDRFFATINRGVEFLSRLDRHRELVPVIVLMVSAAPRLAGDVARKNHLLDVLVDPAFYGQLPDVEMLAAALDEALGDAPDYEGKLDALRVIGREQLLLIEVRILTGSLASADAGAAISEIAELLTERALSAAAAEFAVRHGGFPDGRVAILGLGSFGSREMTPLSDLDLVFIYDTADEAMPSDGEKPLSPGHYHARLAQRFIAALAAPTARGKLFDVDLRLRPSGRSGPLATHIRSFERYHAESAWVWEQMALTRARVVAGDQALGGRAMEAIGAALSRPRDRAALAAEVAGMRAKMEAHHADDLKHGPGGLIDIEFIVQFLRLASGVCAGPTSVRKTLEALDAAGVLSRDAREALSEAHRILRKLLLLFATAGVAPQIASAPAALVPLLLRAADAPDESFLAADLAERRAAVRALFEAIVGAEAGTVPPGKGGS